MLGAAYREYAAVLGPAVFEHYLTDLLDLHGRAGTGRLLVAERAGHVVGTVTFFPDARVEGFGWPAGWAGLRALGVAPAARSCGVGRSLMQECCDRARDAGASVLCLRTAAFMTAAVRLYEAMGFRRASEFDFDASSRFRIDHDDRVTVVAYRADL